jgi:hypothetical protein
LRTNVEDWETAGLHEIVAWVPLDGSLAGLGRGLERKRSLLDLERAPF